MLKTTLIGLGAGALLSLAAAATPAFANYGHCGEEPDSADCRTYNMPGLPPAKGTPAQPSVHKPIVHAHNHPVAPRTQPQKG